MLISGVAVAGYREPLHLASTTWYDTVKTSSAHGIIGTANYQSFCNVEGNQPDSYTYLPNPTIASSSAGGNSHIRWTTELIASSGAEGLAALVAYESQAPAIAAAKAAGLRDRYGLDASATEFWDVHATMDEDHAAWAIEALAGLGPDSPTITAAFRQAADAWWAFLDEREAARPLAHA